MRDSIWTLSNALTCVRVLLVIPIAFLLAPGDPSSRMAAVALIVAATLSDFFDGLIARKLHQVTEFGKILDPIADKIAVGVVAWILTQQGKLPVWFLFIVLLRDAAIFIGGVHLRRTKGIVLQSNYAGKWAVTVIAALILFSIVDLPGTAWLHDLLLAASTVLLALSSGLYLKRFLEVRRNPGGGNVVTEGPDGIS
jgi:CDP-diacylglycerol--glycerol-3-phosphate 3-phosphatidyltransferase